MGNLTLIEQDGYKIETIGIAFLCLVVILILLHLLTNAAKFKKQERATKRRLELEFNKNSSEVQKVLNIAGSSKKYKGTFKSYKKKEQKQIKKFLLSWLKKVPYYSRLNHKKHDKKYKQIYIGVSKDPAFKKFDKQWDFKFKNDDKNKNAKYNLKKLIKFMNKTKVAKGILDVLCNIYSEDSNYKTVETNYYTKEGHTYITYYVAKRKH